uniref:Uncharacterized protein n=1 Tax=Laticauda laticaudata TaxID=8630 RepID=A0A8C5S6G2_LATLA
MQITLKTLQQQTFKIDIDCDETVRRVGARSWARIRKDGIPRPVFRSRVGSSATWSEEFAERLAPLQRPGIGLSCHDSALFRGGRECKTRVGSARVRSLSLPSFPRFPLPRRGMLANRPRCVKRWAKEVGQLSLLKG